MRYNNIDWEGVIDETYKKIADKVGNKQDFEQWMRARKNIGHLFDAYMILRLYLIYKKKLLKDNDYVIAVCGSEGCGKSTFAMQLSAWIDLNFNNKKVCFGFDDTINNFRNNKPCEAVQLDEGAYILLSREAMTDNNRKMLRVFMAIRQKRFFITICCPSFRDLDTYIRTHRINMLVYITQRGKYICYFGDSIRIINENLHIVKKVTAVKVPSEYFWKGYFEAKMPSCIDSKAYFAGKNKHIDSYLDEIISVSGEMSSADMMPVPMLAAKLSISPRRLRGMIRNGYLEAKKIGNFWYVSRKSYEKMIGVAL